MIIIAIVFIIKIAFSTKIMGITNLTSSTLLKMFES